MLKKLLPGRKKNPDVPRHFFRVRAVEPSDVEGLNDVASQNLNSPGNITDSVESKKLQAAFHRWRSLDHFCPAAQRAKHAIVVAEACDGDSKDETGDDLEKLSVVVPPLPHRILAFAITSSFRPDPKYEQTAAIQALLLPPTLLTAAEDRKAIIRALVRACVRVCKERDLRWRVLMAEMPLRENHVRWQEYATAFQEEGFREVGKLENVFEAEGQKSNVVFLQRDL